MSSNEEPRNSLAQTGSDGGLSLMQLHQMVFIYNAVMAGWSVKRIERTGNFRFKKKLHNDREQQSYLREGFLQRFVQNMQRLDTAGEADEPTTGVIMPGTEVTTQLDHISSFEIAGDQDIVLE